MKGLSKINRLISQTGMVLALIVLLSQSLISSEVPEITVVYPRANQIVSAKDSTFIFGHLPEKLDSKPKDVLVYVNGHRTRVHPEGGFLAFVPVSAGEFVFELRAYRKKDLKKKTYVDLAPLASVDLPVIVREPLKPVPDDTLKILGEYNGPRGDIVLSRGETLEVMFRGTPGLIGWFSIPGVVDSVPMSETEPRLQAYWGESVFGAGAVPDSLKLRGIYAGSYRVPDSVSAKEVSLVYYLAPPSKHEILASSSLNSQGEEDPRKKTYLTMPDRTTRRSAYKVSLNSPEFPVTVRFTDSVQIIRHRPGKGYFSIFQPEGVEALAVGSEGDWYKLKLSSTRYAWAKMDSVEKLPPGIKPRRSLLSSVRTFGTDDGVVVEFPLSGKHSFRVVESDKKTLRVQLFGVISDTDWIRYDISDPMIDVATWAQPEVEVYELTIRLNQVIWGYDTYYSGNTFNLKISRVPEEVWRLKGKTIVIDPGHSSDPGAIGPTEYTEAEANLGIALVLRHMLRSAGANVIMTRDDNSHVPLYDRPAIAKAYDADLFISVHNNALPDGVNPLTHHGVSTYYYHPHSIDLARAIQKELIQATGMPDHGFYHGNLAVNRPTQYPAVLVECAFMMIPEQESMLKKYPYRKKVATGIVKGINEFLREFDDGR